PAPVLAIGVLVTFIWTPLYDTLWILILAFAIKFLPYGLRTIGNNMLQVHKELEEASLVSGGRLFYTLRRVILPLTKPGLIAAWSLLMILFMRQFSLPMMLSSPRSNVITSALFQEFDTGGFGHVAAFGILVIGLCVPCLVVAQWLSRR